MATPIRRLLRSLRESTLLRNTGWMFGGYGLQILIQSAYFVLIARSLGSGQYGAFVAVTAMVSVAAPFCGFGAANLLVKNVARDRSLMGVYWGNGLLAICASGVGFLAVILSLARFLLPSSVTILSVLMVGVSDLILVKVADLASAAFQSILVMRKSAQLQVFTSLFRLGGILLLRILYAHPTAAAWAVVYFVATGLTAAYGLLYTTAQVGRPRFSLSRIGPEFVEGFYFSVSLSAQTIYNDVDKMMLARMVALDATGIYTAAYRVIDVAFSPVRSLLNAAYPSVFRHGAGGIGKSFSFCLRLTRPAVIYSVCAAAAMWVGAPLLPHLLGPQFAATAEALRWLALLPLLKSVHYFMGEALTGAGFQGTRASLHVAVAVFNVLINLWLIPAYGWRGAAFSSLLSDALLAVSMFGAVRVRSHLHMERTV